MFPILKDIYWFAFLITVGSIYLSFTRRGTKWAFNRFKSYLALLKLKTGNELTYLLKYCWSSISLFFWVNKNGVETLFSSSSPISTKRSCGSSPFDNCLLFVLMAHYTRSSFIVNLVAISWNLRFISSLFFSAKLFTECTNAETSE